MNRRSFLKGFPLASALVADMVVNASSLDAAGQKTIRDLRKHGELFLRKGTGQARQFGCCTVSCQMLESLTPELSRAMYSARFDPTLETLDELRRAMLLPDNCRIDAVSPHHLFRNNQVMLRIECEDFPWVQEGQMMMEIEPWYRLVNDVPRFDGWSEPAIRNKHPLHKEQA